MTPEQRILKQKIIWKLLADVPLTDAEEYFYLTVIIGKTPQEAETIMAIAENKDPQTLID